MIFISGRFAGPIFADKPVDFAGLQRQIDIAQRRDAAEGFRDTDQFEQGRQAAPAVSV